MIGKTIYTLLSGNTDLTTLVPLTSIFPYIINEDTPLPAIIYTINTLAPTYDKDGWTGDDYTFSVTTYSQDYSKLQDIVSEVRSSFELKKGTTASIRYLKIYLEGQDEGFNVSENVFMNRLTFRVHINGYV